MWVMAAMFGMQLLQGASQNKKIKESNKTAEFNAQIQDQLTQANNTVAAATGALNRHRQSLANQLKLKAGGKQVEALGQNLLRLQDQSQQQGLNVKIQAAEQTGALMAAAAGAGIGGGTVDMLNATVRGKEARLLEQIERNNKANTRDTLDRISQVKEATAMGLDDTVFLDRVTQVKTVPQIQATRSWGDIAMGAAMSTLGTQAGIDAVSKVGTGISNWFKSAPDAMGGANLQIGGYNPVSTGIETPIQTPQSWFTGG